MTLAAVDEALRNAVAVGADPDQAAILDNFSWGNCEKPDRLGALVIAAKACYTAAKAYGTPFVSGKDSLNNEYRVGDVSVPIPPTLLISCIAQMPDVGHAQTMDAKAAGNVLFLVGETRAELGGSHFLEHVGDAGSVTGGTVPRPDLARAPGVLRAMFRASRSGLVRACHDLSEGGLGIAAAEMAFAGGLGVELELASVQVHDAGAGGANTDADALRLFSESTTRFLVEVAPKDAEAFETVLDGVALARVGRVTGDGRLRIVGVRGEAIADVDIETLRRAHTGAGGQP
jgi:phosphoribosylformylglycinamidine synthase